MTANSIRRKASPKRGGTTPASVAPLREWESHYPDYPNLFDDDHLADHAAILKRFIERVRAGKPVPKRTLRLLAERFYLVLIGAHWDEAFPLPGRELPQTWGVRHPKDERDLALYCEVANLIHSGVRVAAAIQAVSTAKAASFETVRAAYYAWRKRLSNSGPNK